MVNIYKLNLTNLQQRILRLLFVKAGSVLNALNIAKSLKVSQPAVSKALPFLIKEDFITVKKDKESGRFSIQANRDNHKVMQLKQVDNIKLIYESGLADFLEKNFPGGIIILFGSYLRGEDTFNSDIDIAVVGRKSKAILLKNYEEMLERKININFYSSFNEIHKNLKENLFNGFVLYGGIEL